MELHYSPQNSKVFAKAIAATNGIIFLTLTIQLTIRRFKLTCRKGMTDFATSDRNTERSNRQKARAPCGQCAAPGWAI
ncbi:MAG: hypothetical protein ACNYWU_07235 [Desulfobacterales bacterium]